MPDQNLSYLRIFNAIADTTGIDVYINGRIIADNMRYQSFTEYLSALPGIYNLEIYLANNSDSPIFNGDILVIGNLIYTGALSSKDGAIVLELFSDEENRQKPVGACIRFADVAEGNQSYDIYMNGQKLISNLGDLEISNYFCFNAGEYILDVKLNGTDEIVIRHPALTLKYGRYYAVYITGIYEGSPGLQVVIPLEGATYL